MHNLKAVLGDFLGGIFFQSVPLPRNRICCAPPGPSFSEASAASSLQITSPVFPISPLPSSEYIYPEEEGGRKKPKTTNITNSRNKFNALCCFSPSQPTARQRSVELRERRKSGSESPLLSICHLGFLDNIQDFPPCIWFAPIQSSIVSTVHPI